MCETCFDAAVPAGEEDLPGAGRAISAWRYLGAPRSLVLGLKVRGLRSCSPPLARGLRRAILAHGVLGDAVTWVPARPRDIRRRGFDHAEILARDLAALTGLEALPLLRRAGASRDQAGLARSERTANLTGAFGVGACSGRLLLVDDLITTGATARTCATALREAGADGVEVIAVCRA